MLNFGTFFSMLSDRSAVHVYRNTEISRVKVAEVCPWPQEISQLNKVAQGRDHQSSSADKRTADLGKGFGCKQIYAFMTWELDRITSVNAKHSKYTGYMR